MTGVITNDDEAREAHEIGLALADTPEISALDTELSTEVKSEVINGRSSTDLTEVKAKPRTPKTPDQRLKKLRATAEEYWRSLSQVPSPEMEGETALQYLKRKAREGFSEEMPLKARHNYVDSLYDFMTRTRCAVVWIKIQGSQKFFDSALPKDFIDPVQIKLAEVVAEYETSKEVSKWLNKASELLEELSNYKPLCPDCGQRELRLREKGPDKRKYFPRCVICEDVKRVASGGQSILKKPENQPKVKSSAQVTPKEFVGELSIEALAKHFQDGSLPLGFDSGKGGGKRSRNKKGRGNGSDREGGRSEREGRGGRSGSGRRGRDDDEG